MVKDFIGLSWAQCIDLAKATNRLQAICPETEDEVEYLEVATSHGNGAALFFEDGVCTCYEYCGWC